jgi:hypothetical protein
MMLPSSDDEDESIPYHGGKVNTVLLALHDVTKKLLVMAEEKMKELFTVPMALTSLK